MSRGGAGLGLALATGLAACAEPSPTPLDATVDATPYALAFAAPRADGYEVLGPEAGIEMRLGFQGFRYTRVTLVATGSVPATTPGVIRFDIEGFDPAEQRVNAVTFRETDPGRFVSEPLMVFQNDVSLSRAAGHLGTISFVLDDRRHRAAGSYSGVLRWDPTCVEDSNFQCQALDGGAP